MEKISILCCLLFAINAYAVQQADTEATLIAAPPVTYPLEARKNGVQGFVILELHVDAKGKITQARVGESSGNAALDDAALEWVNTVKLKPATHNGEPVESIKPLKVSFALKDEDPDMPQLSEGADSAQAAQKMAEYMVKKVQINAAYAFCGQSTYLKCYAVDYMQCVDEVSSIKDDCFRRAQEKYPHAYAENYFGNFMNFYFACMHIKHTNMHISNVLDIERCVQASKMNDDKFAADLRR